MGLNKRAMFAELEAEEQGQITRMRLERMLELLDKHPMATIEQLETLAIESFEEDDRDDYLSELLAKDD